MYNCSACIIEMLPADIQLDVFVVGNNMTISYTSMFIYYEVHDLRQCEFVPLASTYS